MIPKRLVKQPTGNQAILSNIYDFTVMFEGDAEAAMRQHKTIEAEEAEVKEAIEESNWYPF